jgi:hypothetical protein
MGYESYDGNDVFGLAVHIQNIPMPAAQQVDSYFGSDGKTMLWGGTRGRTFEVKGVLFGVDIPSLIAAEAFLLSYADGITRVLVDPVGRVFPNVYFAGEYVPSPEGPKWNDQGVILPYTATFRGLT